MSATLWTPDTATADSATAVLDTPAGRHVQLPNVERRTVGLDGCEFRSTADTLTFEGHAAVFDSWSEVLGGQFRERIQRGAFRKALRNNPDVRFLINHDGLPLARSTVKSGAGSLQLEEDTRGLFVRAELVPTSEARDLQMLVSSGVVSQMSFGFTMRDGGSDSWNADYTERTITEFGGLFDVSAVTYPAYTETDATMRSVVCGVEIVDERGAINRDMLDTVAQRIHRGSLDATVEERTLIDQLFAQFGCLSPWTEELARRALGLEPAAMAPFTQAEETDVMADAVARWRLGARKRRLVLLNL